MTHDENVERVAEALADANAERFCFLQPHQQGRYRAMARAAIAAMQPTPQEAPKLLLRDFTSDESTTDYKPAWEAYRSTLWKKDGSIYEAQTAFFRAISEDSHE